MKRFTKYFLVMALFIVIGSAFVFAGDTTGVVAGTAPSVDLSTLLFTALTPLVVYGATKLVTFLTPKIPSVYITAAVVPVVSAIGTYIATLLGTPHSWLAQFALGLGATFIHEFISNLNNPTPTPAPSTKP